MRLEDAEGIALLRARLEEIDFRPEAIQRLVGPQESLLRDKGDREVQLRRLPAGLPLATAAKLFLLGVAVPAEEARSALAPIPLERLARMGLLDLGADGPRARVRLLPYEGLVLASDRHDEVEAADASPDFVGNVNRTSVTLATLTVRRPVETALDLGTGCGVQALLAARHAGRVVALDVNARALAYGRFNAALNGFANVEWREGSFFEPVAGESFDLIVANPPFVISPDARFTFRDSGLAGDEVCRLVVGEAAGRLRDGGFAHVLCCWAGRRGEDWRAVPTAWVAGSGCDAWILHHGSKDPLAYAAGWNQLLRGSDPPAYSEAIDRWLGYYESLGIETLHYGAVILRRRDGARPWVRADELPGDSRSQAGEHILRVFAAQDYLAGLDDGRALLDERLALVEDHMLEQVLRCRGGEVVLEGASMRLERGLAFEGGVDGLVLAVLVRCDGARRLGDVIEEVARSEGLDPEEASRSGLAVLRRLLELGFLVRKEEEPPGGGSSR